MDRFSWISSSTQLQAGELLVLQQRGLRIYDGENKVGRTHTFVNFLKHLHPIHKRMTSKDILLKSTAVRMKLISSVYHEPSFHFVRKFLIIQITLAWLTLADDLFHSCFRFCKTHNLFRVDENSLEQCCAAHIVQCCQ